MIGAYAASEKVSLKREYLTKIDTGKGKKFDFLYCDPNGGGVVILTFNKKDEKRSVLGQGLVGGIAANTHLIGWAANPYKLTIRCDDHTIQLPQKGPKPKRWRRTPK